MESWSTHKETFKLSKNQGLQMTLMGFTWQLFGSARQGSRRAESLGAELDGGEGLEPVTVARTRSRCGADLPA